MSRNHLVVQSATRSFQSECVRRSHHRVEVALGRSFGGRRLLVAKLKQPLRISTGGRRRTGAAGTTTLVGKNRDCPYLPLLSTFHRLNRAQVSWSAAGREIELAVEWRILSGGA